MAHKIERSSKRRGRSSKTAERIAWATVNKRTGGAKGKSSKKSSRAKGGTRRKSSSRSRSRSRSRS
jgi:hypothetical protein